MGAPLGECDLLASVSASNPRRAWAYFRAGADGDFNRFTELYRELAGVLGAVRRAAGSASLNDGAYDKLVAKITEPDFPLSLLPPYESSTDAGYLQYRDELAARFPDWLPVH